MVKEQGRIRRIINEIVARLERKNIKVDKIILYGSYAKGNPRADSDIDVAVISSSFNNKNILRRQELLGEVMVGLNEPVEAIGYGSKEFSKRSPFSFLFEIASSGKVVYQG